MLREQIRGVDVSPDFQQFCGRILESLMDPESSGINVPQLAQPGSAADANGCRRVSPYPETNLPAQVFHEGLVSQSNSGGFYNVIELSFSTAEAGDCLSRAP